MSHDPEAALEKLPPVTLLVEWENALDVDAFWIRRAMSALESELVRCHNAFTGKPQILYLYDQNVVKDSDIRDFIAGSSPDLDRYADVRTVATPGLTYYQLKNHGANLAQTGIVACIDSDAAPEPGWLHGLLGPFKDPSIMAVAGFTTLGHNDFLSRVMALSWIFDLPSERKLTVQRRSLHANNCAFRTQFFRANPFPELDAFKKQCGFWSREMDRRGVNWIRTDKAMTIHAPHPGVRFLMRRAFAAGRDKDYACFQRDGHGRSTRLRHAARFLAKKVWRCTKRLLSKGGEVGLPVWQRYLGLPAAWSYFLLLFAAQVWFALTATYETLDQQSYSPKPKV